MGEQSGSPDYEDLVWGNGPVVLDVFIEPTCPFCARAFAKFRELLARAGEDRLTLRLWMQSQPWHNFSGPVVRTVLAATGPGGGKEAAWEAMAAIFARREDFVLVEHRTGPNLDLSPAGILRRIGEMRRYGTLWPAVYACAWLVGAGKLTSAWPLIALLVMGVLGMTILREAYAMVEDPIEFRR